MVQQTHSDSKPSFQKALFQTLPRSDFADFLRITHEFIQEHPDLLDKIDKDLNAHAKEKKKWRKLDQAWEKKQTTSFCETVVEEEEIDTDELTLHQGRPRTPAYVVFLLMMSRAYHGGASSREFQDMMAESKSLDLFIRQRGYDMPKRSTSSELMNAVSNQTRDEIINQQVEWIEKKGLDAFDEIYQDSTHVEADTEFPHDATIIRKLLDRIWTSGTKLDGFGLENFERGETENRLKKIRKAELKIKLVDHKSTRKKNFRRMYEFGEKLIQHFQEQYKELVASFVPGSIKPSRQKQLEELRDRIREDIEKARNVIEYSRKRVMEGEKTASKKKVLSVGDGDAAFIKKGNRDPVVGYRPQIARSKNGFIPVCSVPEGNAGDAPRMMPAVQKWEEVTGKVPGIGSWDGGYADGESVKELFEMGMDVVSIAGSKGRQILGEQRYDSQEYQEARRNRSRVESSIYVLKDVYEFDRASRRGIEEVRAELREDVIAHNFMCAAQLLREQNEEQKKSLRKKAG